MLLTSKLVGISRITSKLVGINPNAYHVILCLYIKVSPYIDFVAVYRQCGRITDKYQN